ncbi:MAG TPA: FAD:protein FMN transferase [Candidatus Dormibacteraeota bacterium]
MRLEFQAMGTGVTVLVPAADRRLGDWVEDLFRAWEVCLSRFREDSELSRLNARAGQPVTVSRLLFDAVEAALGAAQATGGLFDPTMLHQIRGLGYDRTFSAIDPTSTRHYRPAPGGAWREVRLDPGRRTVQLPDGAGLDLGGIAKGMAVDAALAGLREAGAACAAVNAGGDLAVTDPPDGYTSWPIEIETNREPCLVSLAGGALATSSVGRRRWREGMVERHHLLDPASGLPVDNEVWSATAAARSCRDAEVAAKAALMLGEDGGARFLERHQMPGLLVLKDGRQVLIGSWAPIQARG